MQWAVVRKKLCHENPVRGVVRFASHIDERRLRDHEYAQLAKPLELTSDRVHPIAVAMTRFLLFTRWRPDEARNLTPRMVDLNRGTVYLPDTKTGVQSRVLSKAACDVLRDLHSANADARYFPALHGDNAVSLVSVTTLHAS